MKKQATAVAAAIIFMIAASPNDSRVAMAQGDCAICDYVQYPNGQIIEQCSGSMTGASQCMQPQPGICDTYGSTCCELPPEQCPPPEAEVALDGTAILPLQLANGLVAAKAGRPLTLCNGMITERHQTRSLIASVARKSASFVI